jgi:hypothetical protein
VRARLQRSGRRHENANPADASPAFVGATSSICGATVSGPQAGILHDALWPPGATQQPSVWAVLDCARDPAVYRALIESRLEFRCLYSGRLPAELERAAPQLVELLPDHRLVHRLLTEGWGRSWGVFIKIADPSPLRHHLRKFLKVRDEDDRSLIFRFYDPRVLRAYLPSCRPGEIETFFGPIAAFLTEDEGAGTLTEFRHQRGHLVDRRHRLESAS